jgi:hypothetical protein
MKEICNNLIDTFDTRFLDNENKIIQSAFYSQAKQYKDTKYDNTLFKLIRNHYDPLIQEKRPVVDFLGGPYTFRHLYNKKYNMNIYLFGELHANKVDCPIESGKKIELVENYFKKIIENTDVFLDIYFEFPGYYKNYYSNITPMAPQRMQELFRQFYNCVQEISRKSKECELTRMHYIDIRTIIETFSGTNEISWLIGNLLLKSHDENLLKTFYNNNIFRIKNIFNNLSNPNQKKYLDYWILQLISNIYVRKEIDRSFLGKEIYNFIKKLIEKYAIMNKMIIRNFISSIEKNINFKDNFERLNIYLIETNSGIVEAYTLARIFKKFKVKNKLEQPVIPRNIIHYAGSAHSLKIEKFLLDIGFEMKEQKGSNIENPDSSIADVFQNCINMSKIKQPLFD